MYRRVIAGAVLFLMTVSGASAATTTCSVGSGQMVMLKSADLDPDVFIWDSRQRVVDYAAGYWKSTRDVMRHSVLSRPGIWARVAHCDRGVVRSKYANDVFDAVAVRLVSGPDRGRYGWVTSEDIHSFMRAPAPRGRPVEKM